MGGVQIIRIRASKRVQLRYTHCGRALYTVLSFADFACPSQAHGAECEFKIIAAEVRGDERL